MADTAISLFDRMKGLALAKPATVSENTQMINPIAVNQIGLTMNPTLDLRPKEVATRLAREFPTQGLEPEQRAQLNMAAKLSAKAANDAVIFTKHADDIMGNMAQIHDTQVTHQGNVMKHDIRFKNADVRHMSNIEGWQGQVYSLLDKAREKHAGIQLLQAAI